MTWWRGAVGYEVYIRSFADSDGDGVGDLRGLHDRLDHLAWLGVDIVWITPFYPSPMHDHGYDVADYKGVDPVFGAMADLDAVVEKAHGLGLRVVVDLVPNHSSSEHRWFRESRSSRDNPYRDYYLWRDPAPDGGPPNNWVSHFGGLAWTLDETTGQYWCHLFLPEQPDLNWANEAVRAQFDDILRFWLDRGVDGFRIDVAHQLVKHPDLPDNPVADEPDDVEMGTTASIWETLEHRYDSDQPGTVEIYRRWRKVADPYDALLLGEVYLLEAEHFERYVRDDDGLNLAFWFTPLHVGWDVDLLRRALVDGAGFRRGGVAWVSGSHDRPRAVSRFGGGEVGRRRALVLSTLLFGMPGTPFLYQGEELGLPDGVITSEEAQDPIAVRTGELEHSRDVCRTPMPWTPGPGLGFTTAARAWLPFGNRVESDTVAVQRADESSTIHRYRRLVGLRRETADLHTEPVEWLTDEGPLIAYRRGGTIVAANCGAQAVALELPEGTWTIVFDTTAATESADAGRTLELAGHQAVVLRRG
ncbi:MAG: DUF3459 domain-containing protein [Euzebyaceae bacterium]|nr:DUF3459 domain-containing protein [Euzebyaceae bacterium]